MKDKHMTDAYKALEVSLPDLAKLAIKAHRGLERWKQFEFLTARLVQGGVLWGLNGKAEVLEHASVKVDLKREWASHWPFAPTDHKSSFTPQRVAIENSNGQVIEELLNPRESFKGYEMETPWSNPQVAYFAGYTMWTYLTSPFILTQPGVVSEEIQQNIDHVLGSLSFGGGAVNQSNVFLFIETMPYGGVGTSGIGN
jgi:hypothetical protein